MVLPDDIKAIAASFNVLQKTNTLLGQKVEKDKEKESGAGKSGSQKTTLTQADVEMIATAVVKLQEVDLKERLEYHIGGEMILCKVPPIPSDSVEYNTLEGFKVKARGSNVYQDLFSKMVNATLVDSNNLRIYMWAFLAIVESKTEIPSGGYEECIDEIDETLEKWCYQAGGDSRLATWITEKRWLEHEE